MAMQITYDRVTFSLPHSMNAALDSLKEELKSSKSDIIKHITGQVIMITFDPNRCIFFPQSRFYDSLFVLFTFFNLNHSINFQKTEV